MNNSGKITSNCNVASIRVENPNTSYDFFFYWLDFLRPFHKLTSVETKILAAILHERFILSKVVTDDKLLDRIILNKDSRKKYIETCHINSNNLSVTLSSLKEKGVIKDNRMNMRFVPNIKHDCTHYEMVLNFNINPLVDETITETGSTQENL